jgi:Mg2+/Co2+ transporter CorB
MKKAVSQNRLFVRDNKIYQYKLGDGRAKTILGLVEQTLKK